MPVYYGLNFAEIGDNTVNGITQSNDETGKKGHCMLLYNVLGGSNPPFPQILLNIQTMRNGTYYLNNSGHRWVVYENGKKPIHEFITDKGNKVKRTAIFYSSFGNFATIRISWKGKKIDVFPDSILQE